MASANYDIYVKQDETFNFHIEYYDTNGNAVDVSSYTGTRFQVRPNMGSIYKYLDATISGVTGGGYTGDWLAGVTMKNGITWVSSGVKGTGGIYLNVGETAGAFTGGIRLTVDYTTMGNVPVGTWVYGLDLVKGITVNELLTGRFVVSDKVVR
jgi:hypothetical protein